MNTLRLRRQASTGGESVAGNKSFDDGRDGSGGRWSGMTIGRKVDTHEPVKVSYVDGKFALPTPSRGLKEEERSMTPDVHRRPSSSSSDAVDSEDDRISSIKEASSNWSGTQRARSYVRADGQSSCFIIGTERDVPREQLVRLIGGTLVVDGFQRQTERDALQSILRLLVSARVYRAQS